MSKYITIYQPNTNGEMEKVEFVDGVVVEEHSEASGGFSDPRTWGGIWAWWTGVVGGASNGEHPKQTWSANEQSEGNQNALPSPYVGFGDGSSSDVDGTDVRGWWS